MDGLNQKPTAAASSSNAAPINAADLAREALEKARRAEQIQKQIQEQLAKLQQDKAKKEKGPTRIMLDEKGNLVDEAGNIINTGNKPVTSIKANLNKQRQEAFKIVKPPDLKKSKFYDPRVPAPKTTRQKRSFHFIEEGTYVKQAEKIRLKAAEREFEKMFKPDKNKSAAATSSAKPALEAALAQNPNMIPLGDKLAAGPQKKEREPIPDVEWWDAVLLPNRTYDDIKDKFDIREKKINIYIEHPVPIQPLVEKPAPGPIPLMLTPKERKKIRTQNRLQREKVKQEKIALGLMPPPPPKVSISNIMRVLGTEASQDPTKVEAIVREQMKGRLQNHQARNEARKLTPEQRREKKLKKIEQDKATDTVVALYKVTEIPDGQKKFKVDMNAQQLHLTGCVVLSESITLIVAEGGPKAIRQFTKLLTRRIDWNRTVSGSTTAAEENMEDEDEDKEDNNNNNDGENAPKGARKCRLVWQGSIQKPSFRGFRFQKFLTEAMARKYLKDHGCEHFWDMCKDFDLDKEDVDV
eukprot:GEZU01025577.1.p1 GENE.GEZU01025577.1~~GEZU01025577.1.p1  ORF type:complete len:540 (-),score=140.42 GEZU01025577.1:60-1631(-)